MTSAEDRRAEFLRRCLDADDPGAVRVDGIADQRRLAGRYRNQAEYHYTAARDHLDGRTPLMAFKEGYYAMLHAANEALALAGFKCNSHTCTLLGLRGIFDAPDLADSLRRGGAERRNVDYRTDPEDPDLQEFQDPREFLENEVDPFIDGVAALLDEEGIE